MANRSVGETFCAQACAASTASTLAVFWATGKLKRAKPPDQIVTVHRQNLYVYVHRQNLYDPQMRAHIHQSIYSMFSLSLEEVNHPQQVPESSVQQSYIIQITFKDSSDAPTTLQAAHLSTDSDCIRWVQDKKQPHLRSASISEKLHLFI